MSDSDVDRALEYADDTESAGWRSKPGVLAREVRRLRHENDTLRNLSAAKSLEYARTGKVELERRVLILEQQRSELDREFDHLLQFEKRVRAADDEFGPPTSHTMGVELWEAIDEAIELLDRDRRRDEER